MRIVLLRPAASPLLVKVIFPDNVMVCIPGLLKLMLVVPAKVMVEVDVIKLFAFKEVKVVAAAEVAVNLFDN